MIKQILLPIAFIMLLSSCNSDKIYEKHKNLDPNIEWKKSNSITFTVPIHYPDTTYDLSVALRHITGYPYRNCLLDVKITSPSGAVQNEKVDLLIRESPSTYNSECMGDFCDHLSLVREKFTFKEAGEYTFEVSHAMDQSILTHVMELGLIVEYH